MAITGRKGIFNVKLSKRGLKNAIECIDDGTCTVLCKGHRLRVVRKMTVSGRRDVAEAIDAILREDAAALKGLPPEMVGGPDHGKWFAANLSCSVEGCKSVVYSINRDVDGKSVGEIYKKMGWLTQDEFLSVVYGVEYGAMSPLCNRHGTMFFPRAHFVSEGTFTMSDVLGTIAKMSAGTFAGIDPRLVNEKDRGAWFEANTSCAVENCGMKPITFISLGGEKMEELYSGSAKARLPMEEWVDVIEGIKSGQYLVVCKKHFGSIRGYLHYNEMMSVEGAVDLIEEKERHGKC